MSVVLLVGFSAVNCCCEGLCYFTESGNPPIFCREHPAVVRCLASPNVFCGIGQKLLAHANKAFSRGSPLLRELANLTRRNSMEIV